MHRRPLRLPGASGEPVSFEWNGRTVAGLAGDSIAAALHASGHRIFTRSRKFHEPRGLSGSFVAGHLAVVDGVPNRRLDRTPLRAGARVRMQGVWPAPGLDLLALARLVPRHWLRAGFEHPRWLPDHSPLWPIWEHGLALAAGPAAAPARGGGSAIPGRRLQADTVVVGGGPAGIEAAGAATGEVVLITRGRAPDGLPDRVNVLCEHEAFALYGHGRLVAAAPSDDESPAVLVDAGAVVLATGMRSTPPLVRGAALPGVMDADTAVELAERYQVAPGARTVVVSTPRGEVIATRLEALGIDVVDFVPIERLRAIEGHDVVTGVVFDSRRTDCDAVVHAGPWRPDPSLPFQAAASGELRLRAEASAPVVTIAGSAAEPPEPVAIADPPDPDALVCPCMDVTVGEVLAHVRLGVTHVEEIKRLTGCGMGACQGVPCWDLLAALVAGETGRSVEEIGHPSYRPPRAALTFAQAAGLADRTEVGK